MDQFAEDRQRRLRRQPLRLRNGIADAEAKTVVFCELYFHGIRVLLCAAKLLGISEVFDDWGAVAQESVESPAGRPSFTICSRMLRYSWKSFLPFVVSA